MRRPVAYVLTWFAVLLFFAAIDFSIALTLGAFYGFYGGFDVITLFLFINSGLLGVVFVASIGMSFFNFAPSFVFEKTPNDEDNQNINMANRAFCVAYAKCIAFSVVPLLLFYTSFFLMLDMAKYCILGVDALLIWLATVNFTKRYNTRKNIAPESDKKYPIKSLITPAIALPVVVFVGSLGLGLLFDGYSTARFNAAIAIYSWADNLERGVSEKDRLKRQATELEERNNRLNRERESLIENQRKLEADNQRLATENKNLSAAQAAQKQAVAASYLTIRGDRYSVGDTVWKKGFIGDHDELLIQRIDETKWQVYVRNKDKGRDEWVSANDIMSNSERLNENFENAKKVKDGFEQARGLYNTFFGSSNKK